MSLSKLILKTILFNFLLNNLIECRQFWLDRPIPPVSIQLNLNDQDALNALAFLKPELKVIQLLNIKKQVLAGVKYIYDGYFGVNQKRRCIIEILDQFWLDPRYTPLGAICN